MQIPAVPPSEEMSHRARVRTRWSDEDNHGVLNNAVYLTLFEEARHSYFASLDLLDGARFPFLLGQTNVVFLRPGRGAADVVVEVATVHIGRTSFAQAFRVREAESGAVWCEAVARMVSVDGAGAPLEIAAEFRSRVEELEAAARRGPVS
ncbi:MAG: thioesterase family protein [Planctomycetota bacterium]